MGDAELSAWISQIEKSSDAFELALKSGDQQAITIALRVLANKYAAFAMAIVWAKFSWKQFQHVLGEFGATLEQHGKNLINWCNKK